MLKIITINVNGIRSSAKKGLFEWIKQEDPDIVCLQEVKAQQDQITDPLYHPTGYHCYYVDAVKKGYSGVAVYSKHLPKQVHTRMDWLPADEEGRFLQIDFDNLSVASLYFPSGTSGDERQNFKYAFLDQYTHLLEQQLKSGREYILCGDWNIAHKEIDLKNWKSNQKNSGFLPEERAWLDKIFAMGYVDAFRVVNNSPDQYTWWSNRGQAWAKNVGWRIDYQIVTPGLKPAVKQTEIYKAERFSDHAPLTVVYDV